MKILVADDIESTRIMLREALKKFGYEVVCAKDGDQAWEIIQNSNINMVLSDWMMPQMNGLELCQKIRSSVTDHYVFIILLTAQEHHNAAVEGFAAGADDFLNKPINPVELHSRIVAGERLLSLEKTLENKNKELQKKNLELESAYRTMSHDLKSAQDMQTQLLPQYQDIQGIHAAGLYRPSDMLSGDIFNYFPLDNNHLAFFHIDISGHGVPAALLSFSLHNLLSLNHDNNSLLKRWDEAQGIHVILPSHLVIAELNKRCIRDDGRFLTMVYGVIDSKNLTLDFCCAGHPPIIIRRKLDKKAVFISGPSFPIGIFEEADYSNIELTLHTGDRLFFYSDGITECHNNEAEMFSDSQLLDIIDQQINKTLFSTIDDLDKQLRKWRRTDKYEDDVSLLALEIQQQ